MGPFRESPPNPLRSQGPYRACFLMGWINELAGSRLGGAWIMPLQHTPHTLDTAYQTLLGGPRELVLHPLPARRAVRVADQQRDAGDLLVERDAHVGTASQQRLAEDPYGRIGRSIPDVIAAYHEGCSLLSRSSSASV